MKKLKLKLDGMKDMLSKDQMKKITGGSGCTLICLDASNEQQLHIIAGVLDAGHCPDSSTAMGMCGDCDRLFPDPSGVTSYTYTCQGNC